MTVLEKILEIFFPTKCGICGKLGKNICENCYNNLKKYEIIKQHNDIYFVYRYEDIIRELLIKYKFNGNAYLYKTFSECLLKNKKVCKFLKSYDIILSVPLHKKRQRERGYNQSTLIAKELAKGINNQIEIYNSKNMLHKKLEIYNSKNNMLNEKIENNTYNLKFIDKVLIKNKNIKPQSEKGIKERINDVKGIYSIVNNSCIYGKKVLLFDDIYTTGSTTNECKKILLEAGAKEVGILTIAKDYIN